jgi:hypothetical protein
MPWKECHVMDERLRFVARLLEGEKIAHRHRAVWSLRQCDWSTPAGRTSSCVDRHEVAPCKRAPRA